MKVNDPNLNSLASSEALRSQGAARAGSSSRNAGAGASGATDDDVHLSELVRSLRSLASDSPERQQRLEEIARAYASGTYQVDAQALAGKIIDDAVSHS